MNLPEYSATEIAKLVTTKKIQAREVVTAHIARIEKYDGALNCFTDHSFTRALTEADEVDSKIAAGINPGPLAGVPIAVKNLFDVAGLPTRAGSKIFRDAKPATKDAAILQKLTQAGAVLLGATNMDEFAYGFVTENAHDGPTRNPHDPTRIAGGSSGGSAAAVAAGFAPITLGSDTNGSIRLPAGLCGIFGLKPTYGRIDRTGTFPFIDSLDHLGPFARTTEDLELAYNLMQDSDPPAPPPKLSPARIAVLDDWFQQGATTEMLEAVQWAATGLGATTTATLPRADIARAAAFCITAFEGGQLHKENLTLQPQNFDPATRPRLIAGALQPAQTILQAQRFRTWFRSEAAKLFEKFDLLIAPATPTTAPLIGQQTMRLNSEIVPVRPNLGLYTQPISFIGLPVVCVPISSPTSLPRGIQIIAPPGQERLALAAAAHLQAQNIATSKIATPP